MTKKTIKRYSEAFKRLVVSEYEDGARMVNLQKKYGVEYYDFSNDPSMISHPELFYNSDHLNDCGQKVISQKLREQMENLAK